MLVCMVIASTPDPPGEISGTERAIYGAVTLPEVSAFLDAWAQDRLGSTIVDVRFRAGRIDAVWGVELQGAHMPGRLLPGQGQVVLLAILDQGDGGVIAVIVGDQCDLPAGVEGEDPGGCSGGRSSFALGDGRACTS
jgi:hypothetical protein